MTVPQILAGLAALFFAATPAIFLTSERRGALRLGSAAGVPLAYALGHCAAFGAPTWRDWEHQPFWLAVALCLILPVIAARRKISSSFLASIFLAALVIWPGVSSEWTEPAQRWTGLAAFGVAAFGTLVLSSFWFERSGRLDGALILGLLCAAAGATALASGYALFLAAAALVGGSLIPACLAASIRGEKPHSTVSFTGLALWISLLAGAWFHTFAAQRAPTSGFLLVLVAPQAAWLGELPIVRNKPFARFAVRVGAVAILLGVAILLDFMPGSGDGGETDGYDPEW